jgi:hypothetical protein
MNQNAKPKQFQLAIKKPDQIFRHCSRQLLPAAKLIANTKIWFLNLVSSYSCLCFSDMQFRAAPEPVLLS